MCGIAGIVRFDRPARACGDELFAMQRRLVHRGPDGRGEWFGTFAALAHTRLAMVDASGGSQPFLSADGRYALVYNGELYNHHELRARLPGPWRTRSDTETVVAAWAAWGEATVDRLDGMYAFFVWDTEREEGFAVRDRLGVKPLCYRVDGGFSFASEAKALLAGSTRRADVTAIVDYLTAPAFSGVARSPFEGVHYLPAGHLLRVHRGGVDPRRYFRWRTNPEPVGPAELREELERAVGASLRSDAPLGVFLSGGLDSTALAAIAAKSGNKLPAFTIRFDGEDQWSGSVLVMASDTAFARDAADELGLEHHEVVFPRQDLASEIAAVATVDDALPAWEQELSQRTLARAASEHVKGVLVGDAADETHYGYHFLLDEEAIRSPGVILRRFGTVPVRCEIDADPIGRFVDEAEALAPEGASRVDATTQLIVERWLPRLLHNGDIHTMAFGLEARVPFASTRLVELAMRVAPRAALAGGVEKALLREALRGAIPESIRTRRKSALPKDQATSELYRREVLRVVAEPHDVVRAIVDVDAVRALVAGPAPLDERARAAAFRVIALHRWGIAYEVSA